MAFLRLVNYVSLALAFHHKGHSVSRVYFETGSYKYFRQRFTFSYKKISVSDPDPGSGIRIGFFGSWIADPGSRILDPKPIFLRA